MGTLAIFSLPSDPGLESLYPSQYGHCHSPSLSYVSPSFPLFQAKSSILSLSSSSLPRSLSRSSIFSLSSLSRLQWRRNRGREDRAMMRSASPSYAPAILSSKTLAPVPALDLPPPRKLGRRRRTRNPIFPGAAAGARSRRDGSASGGRKSGPATPLLRWKFDDADRSAQPPSEFPGGKARRKHRKAAGEVAPVVSARKLAAGLWHLQLPEASSGGGERRGGRLEFEVRPQDPLLFLFRWSF